MENNPSVPALSPAEAESFFASGYDAVSARPSVRPSTAPDMPEFSGPFKAIPRKLNDSCCVGIDLPAIGLIHSANCHHVAEAQGAGKMPEPLRRFLDGERGSILDQAGDVFTDGALAAAELRKEREVKKQDEARSNRRDALLAQLIFRARELAQAQLVDHGYATQCGECKVGGSLPGNVVHLRTCCTGAVLGILRELIWTLDVPKQEEEKAATVKREQPAGVEGLTCLRCRQRGGIWLRKEKAGPENRVAYQPFQGEAFFAAEDGSGCWIYRHVCAQKDGAL